MEPLWKILFLLYETLLTGEYRSTFRKRAIDSDGARISCGVICIELFAETIEYLRR